MRDLPSVRGVSVLGTGTMAPGIAVVFAQAGLDVTLWGRTEHRAHAARARAGRAAELLATEKLGPPAADTLNRIHVADTLAEAVADVDLVVEAISEDLAAKQTFLAEVEAVCARQTLIATNTSGLRVTDIANRLEYPDRAVAMLFWNPAHLMPIVEIVGGEQTAQTSVEGAQQVALDCKKVPVVLKREVLGFLGTRLQQVMVREAVALLDAGVASAADIDLAVRTSFGIRLPAIGPLESADLSGLDVIEAVHQYLLPDLDNSTAPQPGLHVRVAAGDVGVKSGRGFYDWEGNRGRDVAERRDRELIRRARLLAEAGLEEVAG